MRMEAERTALRNEQMEVGDKAEKRLSSLSVVSELVWKVRITSEKSRGLISSKKVWEALRSDKRALEWR